MFVSFGVKPFRGNPSVEEAPCSRVGSDTAVVQVVSEATTYLDGVGGAETRRSGKAVHRTRFLVCAAPHFTTTPSL